MSEDLWISILQGLVYFYWPFIVLWTELFIASGLMVGISLGGLLLLLKAFD